MPADMQKIAVHCNKLANVHMSKLHLHTSRRSLVVLFHSSKVDKDRAQTHHFNFVLQQDQQDPDTSGKQISYYAALSLLRGKVYDALENHGRAVKWYQAALKADPFCYEAFQVTQLDNELALGTLNCMM